MIRVQMIHILLFTILDSRSRTVQARMAIYQGKDMSEAAQCLGARWIVILSRILNKEGLHFFIFSSRNSL
jgi:hypothetical protein